MQKNKSFKMTIGNPMILLYNLVVSYFRKV